MKFYTPKEFFFKNSKFFLFVVFAEMLSFVCLKPVESVTLDQLAWRTYSFFFLHGLLFIFVWEKELKAQARWLMVSFFLSLNEPFLILKKFSGEKWH